MLTIEGGKFGQRWGLIAEQYGIPVHRHEIEWGTAIDPAWVADYLKKDADITSVMLTHSETSTATLCDVEAIGKIVKGAGKLFLVDGITSVGALPVKPDEWGIDVLITGAQKSLMLPPGLGFLSVSEAAWKVIESNKGQHAYYLNLNAARKSAQANDTPFTAGACDDPRPGEGAGHARRRGHGETCGSAWRRWPRRRARPVRRSGWKCSRSGRAIR